MLTRLNKGALFADWRDQLHVYMHHLHVGFLICASIKRTCHLSLTPIVEKSRGSRSTSQGIGNTRTSLSDLMNPVFTTMFEGWNLGHPLKVNLWAFSLSNSLNTFFWACRFHEVNHFLFSLEMLLLCHPFAILMSHSQVIHGNFSAHVREEESKLLFRCRIIKCKISLS